MSTATKETLQYFHNKLYKAMKIVKRVTCTHCGGFISEGEIDREAMIHHGRELRCKDTKQCNKTAKKRKKRK